MFSSLCRPFIHPTIVVEVDATSWNWEKQSNYSIPFVFGGKHQLRTDDSTPIVQQQQQQVRRSQKERFPLVRHIDHEVYTDDAISDNGELVYFAFMVDSKSLNWEQALKQKEWKDVIDEELMQLRGIRPGSL